MTTPIEILINGKDNTSGAFSSAQSGLSKISQIATGILASQVFTKLAQGAVEFGKSVFTEAMDAQLVMADLDAVLKSTGGAAGVTREAAMSLADGLSTVTRFSDDAILKGENMLLTFTNIGKDVFPMATEAMFNMATKMGTDAGGAAIQLGKALNDPVAGLTALRRVGVQFTEDQEKQIKAMVAAGDVMGAQKLILAELNTEFGGAAKAAGATFAGQMDILKNKVNNLKEGLGLKLMPTLQGFADKMIAFADNPAVIKFFDDMANGIIALMDNAQKLPAIFDGMKAGVESFIKPFLPALRQLMNTFDLMRPSLEKTAGVLGGKLAAAGRELSAKVVPFLVTSFSRLSNWFTANRPLIERFVAIVGENIARLAVIFVKMWTVVEPILSGLLLVILGIGKAVMQVVTGDWAGAWQTAQDILQDAWTAISSALLAALDFIAALLGGSLAGIKAQWTANWNAFKLILTQVWSIIKQTVSNALNNLKSYFVNAWSNIISGARNFASGLISAIVGSINAAVSGASSALSGFVSLGGKIITNIIQGLNNAKNSLLDYLRGIINGLVAGIFGGGFSGGTPPPNGVPSCFVANTMILMGDGTSKPIQDIKIGDGVISYDTKSKKFITAVVANTFVHSETQGYLVIDGIGVTENHPLFVNNEWVEAGKVIEGDALFAYPGITKRVTSISKVDEVITTYNLEIDDDNHNYFADGVLVHNKYASGTNGWVEVPPGYPNDSYPLRVQSGEHFAVVPAGQSVPMSGGRTNNNYYNAHITVYTGNVQQRKSMRGMI